MIIGCAFKDFGGSTDEQVYILSEEADDENITALAGSIDAMCSARVIAVTKTVLVLVADDAPADSSATGRVTSVLELDFVDTEEHKKTLRFNGPKPGMFDEYGVADLENEDLAPVILGIVELGKSDEGFDWDHCSGGRLATVLTPVGDLTDGIKLVAGAPFAGEWNKEDGIEVVSG